MQAFKVVTVKNCSFYFCSLACARHHDFIPNDGEFVMESDYNTEEKCANCDIPLNDTTRAVGYAIPNQMPLRCVGGRGKQQTPEPAPAFNQHPRYEKWKSICPHCRSIHTEHLDGSAEFAVRLRCTQCGTVFTLKEAFDMEVKRQRLTAQGRLAMKTPSLPLSQFSKSKSGVCIPCNEGPIGAWSEGRRGRWHQTVY